MRALAFAQGHWYRKTSQPRPLAPSRFALSIPRLKYAHAKDVVVFERSSFGAALIRGLEGLKLGTNMVRIGPLLALCFVATGDDRMARRVHGDSIFDIKSQIDESKRREAFLQRHGSWPDPQWLQRELPSYSRAMAEREAKIMQITDSQARWDAWMFVAQARILYNFTATQWEVADAPQDIWRRLHAQYHASLAANPKVESSTATLSGVLGPTRPSFLEQEALNYEILDALKPLHEVWAGVKLEATSVYGVRVYRNGSTLKDHLDVPER